MKKFIVAAAALAIAIIGFGTLGSTTTQANPITIYVVNTNVASALAGTTPALYATALGTAAGRATVSSGFAAAQTASAGQISADMANAGDDWVILVTNDSTTASTLTGRGLVCVPACDNVATITPDPTDKMALWHVTGAGTFTGGTVTATQTSITLDSTTLSTVGAAHDFQLAVTKTTIQEKNGGCGFTSSITDPTRAGATGTYTDINGKALVGYAPTFSSSSASNMLVGNAAGTGAASQITRSMLLPDGKTIAGFDVICGVAAGTANLNGVTLPNEIAGLASPFTVTRTQAITITGVPATIALTASPAAIPCDGTSTSTVTAKVTDAAGNNVVDNTPVTFSVVALGTANPINTTTKGGSATSVVTPLSGGTAGTTVQVTSGNAAASIRIDCLPSLATATAAAAGATATPPGGITGPNTGTGGYLSNSSSSGFPLWTLIALAIGSFVLVGGGIAVRRAK